MTCNPLISASHPEPGWQAYCPIHNGWLGPVRTDKWLAKRDADQHADREPEQHPPWQRGPAR